MSRLIGRRDCMKRMAAAAGVVAGGGLGSAGRALLAAPEGSSRVSMAKATVLRIELG